MEGKLFSLFCDNASQCGEDGLQSIKNLLDVLLEWPLIRLSIRTVKLKIIEICDYCKAQTGLRLHCFVHLSSVYR